MLTTRDKLEQALNSDCDIIIAIPDYTPSKCNNARRLIDSLCIRETLQNNIFPHLLVSSDFCYIYGLKEKFDQNLYKENYLSKCEAFENLEIETF